MGPPSAMLAQDRLCRNVGLKDRDGGTTGSVRGVSTRQSVITTPVNDIPELVRHRHNGLLVPEGDAAALADAVASVIQRLKLYDHLQARARALLVELRFDIRQATRQVARLFQASLSEYGA